MALSVGQVVKYKHEGNTFLAVVDAVGVDSVDVSVMVPVNVQKITVPMVPLSPGDATVEE